MSENEWFILEGIIFFSVLLVSFIVVIFIYLFRKKRKKSENLRIGKNSEKTVNSILQNWALNNNSKYISSSLFKYNGNIYFEVDGILITPRSLICVEVKSIKGDIKGNATENTWQKIMGNNVHDIKSPVLQNEKHISHIINVTKVKIPILSLIIFDSERTNNVEITNKPSHVIITKTDQLIDVLSQIDSVLLPKLNNNEIHYAYDELMKCRTSSNYDKKVFNSFFEQAHNGK